MVNVAMSSSGNGNQSVGSIHAYRQRSIQPASAKTDKLQVVSDNRSEESRKLVEIYRQWFDVVPATTPELIRESHRIRYQVYCIETGFEDKSQFTDEIETDEYDSRSVASLLIHRPTGMIAGTVRLILPRENEAELPAFKLSDDLNNLKSEALPRPRTAEISRFAITKQFRKRREDSLIPALYERAGMPGEQRVIPHITLGLMQAILAMSIQNNVTHLTIVVEPALDRLIRKLGIFFTPIGPLIDYHGRRRAHYREIGALLDEVYHLRPEIWEVLTDNGSLWPAPTA